MNQVVRSLERLIRRVRPAARVPRCVSMDVRSEQEVREAARELAGPARMEPAALASLIRELVEMNTPALFLNIVQGGGAVRVVLTPWEGRTTRFRGASYFVDAGSGAPEGVEAFTRAPYAHVTVLYPTAPDHPVYLVSIEDQGTHVYTGKFPPYLTHLSIVVNGVVTARCERLLHERGTQVWSGRVA